MTISKSFTAVGAGGALSLKDGEKFTWAVTGTWVGTWELQKSVDGGMTWQVEATSTDNSTGTVFVKNRNQGQASYRFYCRLFTSGTIITAITEVTTEVVQTFTNKNGDTVAQINEDGFQADKITSDGALSVGGASTLTGAVGFGAATNGTRGTTIASASTIDLDAATGDGVDVSGTTAITAITLAAGRRRFVRFTGILTLTNGASLVLPSGADIVTAAGDWAIFEGYASDVVRCSFYQKVSGNPVTFLRASQKRIISKGAKAGTTAGWVVGAATNVGRMATLPASQSGSTLVIPVDGLKVGDTITGFHLIGQVESAGGTVTLDADLRKLTAAAADLTDASVGAITQLAVVADTILSASNTRKASLADVVGADETFYVLITVTNDASTDIDLMGVAIEFTEQA